jgi:molecular chaperone DnaK
MRAIGIDLGTTNSVIAIVERGQPRALTNRENEVLTPSVVSYFKRRGSETGEFVVGRQAINNAARDPANTVFSIKRLMGRQYGERRVEEVQKRYGYQLAPAPSPDSEDQSVKVLLNGKPYTPVEISAMILKQIKADAERALGEQVTHAVITVPAYFEERQRYATAEAGKVAGLTVLEIIDEPTAAALAFGLGKEDERHRVLVYDLGGGTFDVSLIQMHNNNYNVLAMQGDNWLGGDDFDQMIVGHMLDWIKSEYNIESSKRAGLLMRAKPEAEKAKKALSVQQRTEILWSFNVPDFGMIDMQLELTREQFEKDIADKLRSTIDLINVAMRNQTVTPDDITAVLLVGGSTAIPLVRTLLTEVFGEHKIRADINPMECVALGAALRADAHDLQSLADDGQKENAMVIHRVTPMDLGINTVKGEDLDHFEPIIPKGTPYPLDEPRKKIVHPTEPNQKVLRIPVYEGDSSRASLNELQGDIEIPLSRGLELSQDIEIQFDYDKNRVVTMIVKIVGTDQVYVHRLAHSGPRPKSSRTTSPSSSDPGAPSGGTLQEDWTEGVGWATQSGRDFVQGYGMYMADDDRKELEEALQKAAAALEAKDEQVGKKAQNVIENKIMSSGLASLMYIAERVMSRANARQARLLAQAIAALRQAYAQGPDAHFEQLVQDVRVVVADIINAKIDTVPVVEHGFGGLLKT